jgi:hypothetical protein
MVNITNMEGGNTLKILLMLIGILLMIAAIGLVLGTALVTGEPIRWPYLAGPVVGIILMARSIR